MHHPDVVGDAAENARRRDSGRAAPSEAQVNDPRHEEQIEGREQRIHPRIARDLDIERGDGEDSRNDEGCGSTEVGPGEPPGRRDPRAGHEHREEAQRELVDSRCPDRDGLEKRERQTAQIDQPAR